jgi:F-type H+-transporting ATPase subunit delta
MPDETIARRYATAIFTLAAERASVERVGRDLQAVLDATTADEGVRRFFVSPVIDRKEKARVFAEAFAKSIDEVALHAVLLLIRKRRERYLRDIVRLFGELEVEASGREPLEIVSARELPAADVDALVERLSKLYNKRFVVKQRVDPALIAGLRLTMGDQRIDASIAGRLNQLARSLSQN